MANIKVVITDPKQGKALQMEANEAATKKMQGMKLGDSLKGEVLDMTGYEFQITGGSDNCGFPMRADVPGAIRKRILTRTGVVGVAKSKRKGLSVRKTVCGNIIGMNTAQINVKVVKAGKDPLVFPVKEKKEEAK